MRHLIFVFLILGGCAQNEIGYEKYGISILDLSKDNYVIVDKNGDTLVYNQITTFCKKNNKIIGFRKYLAGDNSIDAPQFTENTGYFELNLTKKSVTYRPELGVAEVISACAGEQIVN